MLGENRSERAIVLIDLINEYLDPHSANFRPQALEILPYVQGELRYFRERMRPVIFCNTAMASAGRPAEVIRELLPRRAEISLKKSRPNAFFNTDLAAILKSFKVRNLTLVGLSMCDSILLTAASAFDHGFSVVVPETCIYCPHAEDQDAALRLLARWSTAMSMDQPSDKGSLA